MKSLPQILLYCLGGFLVVGALVTTIVMTAQYHPPGVKPHQRQAYAEKMRQLDDLREVALNVQNQSKPIAVVRESEFDFGMVDPHTTLTHDFVLKNEGDAPLALSVAGTSCKCTIGNLENDFLPPGEQTTVTLTWNTGYQAERYEQTADIKTNDPLRRTITLRVKGEVKAEFVAPEQVVFSTTDVGVPAEAKFLVYSQAWKDFTVTSVRCDAPGFEWYAEPADPNSASLADAEAAAAWEVRVFSAPMEFGDYKAKINITAEPTDGGEPVQREIACLGKVRKPINFYHPDIHKTLGLDLGTLVAGTEHQFHVVVRARTDVDRKIEVLDVVPKELQATLEPMSTAGSYRLTLTVPADCPLLVFNANEKHGYVQVGDPLNKDFSNWFPLMGAVVPIQ